VADAVPVRPLTVPPPRIHLDVCVRFIPVTVTFAMTLLSACALAQDETDLPVVTEYGYATAAAGVQTFSGDDIRRHFQTLGQFLAGITGVQVQHSGAIGDPVLISVRGATAGQTNVLVNGVRLNDAQGGGYDISEIPLSMIERVELITSGSHGGDYDSAIGGTLNIITRTSESERLIRTSIGSFGYRQVSYRQMAGRVAVYADSVRTHNDFSYPVPTPFDGGPAGSDEALNNAGFYRHNLQLSAQAAGINSRIFWRHQNKLIPDYFRNSPNNNANYEEREAGLSIGNIDQALDSGLNWRWHTRYSNNREVYQDRLSVIGLGNDDNRYQSEHADLQLSPGWRDGALILTASANLSFDDFHARYVNDSDSRDCLTLQGQCDQSAEQWTSLLQAGANYQWSPQVSSRFHLYQQQLRTTNWRTDAQDSQSQTDAQQFSGGSAEIHWQSDELTVQLSGRNSVRLPTMYERYGDRGLMLGNDELAAETADTVSLDAEYFSNFGTAKFTVFRREIDNVIVPVYDSRGIGRYENTSEATLTGIEATVNSSFRLGSLWVEPEFGSSRYQSLVQSDVKSYDGKQLAGIYHGRYTSALRLLYGGHSFTTRYEIAGDLFFDQGNVVEGDTRESLDVAYLWQQTYWMLSLTINNLTDNRYRDFTNRPVVGRSLVGALEFEF
jgi:outer membrane cobalamin receptor